jgi:hypothetical protein
MTIAFLGQGGQAHNLGSRMWARAQQQHQWLRQGPCRTPALSLWPSIGPLGLCHVQQLLKHEADDAPLVNLHLSLPVNLGVLSASSMRPALRPLDDHDSSQIAFLGSPELVASESYMLVSRREVFGGELRQVAWTSDWHVRLRPLCMPDDDHHRTFALEGCFARAKYG